MVSIPDEFWPGFGQDNGPEEVSCGDGGSLAQVVMNKFGIPCSDSRGGSLPDLDIKHMDAMQAVKLSLLEESSDSGDIYEPVMNSNGQIEFKAMGQGNGPSDIYYEIQSGTYREDCSGVMVIGKNPMPKRKPIKWRPIWEGGQMEIYDTGFMYNNCATNDFNQYCTIVYDEPHLNSVYEDGIDNLYDIGADNPHDSIIGYAHYLSWEGWQSDSDASIQKSDSAKILIKMGTDLGTLQRRPHADGSLHNQACFDGQGEVPDPELGVELVLPDTFRYQSVRDTEVDKFIGVVGIYVVGRYISDLRGKPISNAEALGTGFNIWCKFTKQYNEVFTLKRGEDYTVGYADKIPRIVFADNSRVTDPLAIPDGGKCNFFIDPDSVINIDEGGAPITQGEGFILPTGPTSGILVKEIWAGIELDTPSIIVFHPNGQAQKARQIAEELSYLVAPLVTVDAPAPVAFNGSLVDQVSGKVDHDPTTQQNFSDTPLEKAMDEMDAGGGMTLTLSFLEDDQVKKLSGAVYDYMNSGSGVESTYVCGPNCNPELGGVSPNGGIVNSIAYSYQDSNSYTVSVNCGPMLVGGQMAQIDGGPALKITEEVSAKGTILQDSGNAIYYKVHIDGIGDRIAVSMIPAVLRVGDKVTVAIHNNPVEA